jgi:hypothetical protein
MTSAPIALALPPRADPSTGKARGSRRHVRARRNKLHVRREWCLVATVPGIHGADAQGHEQPTNNTSVMARTGASIMCNLSVDAGARGCPA